MNRPDLEIYHYLINIGINNLCCQDVKYPKRNAEHWGVGEGGILLRGPWQPPMDPDNDEPVSKVDFFGGHSNILRSAESRF